jgi:fatty-acyl-CoA synthase
MTDQHGDGLGRARPLTLPTFLERSARRTPDRVALSLGSERRAFRELDERSGRAAAALASLGVAAGDTVAVLTHNSIETVEAFFGCHKLGACAVPVNFRLAPHEVAYILQNSGARGTICSPELRALLPAGGWQLVTGPGGSYEQALAAAANVPPAHVPHEDELAFLMYTSGTTGAPKGAMLTQRNMYAQMVGFILEVGQRADDVWYSGGPLFHVAGVTALLPGLFLGGHSVVAPSTEFDAGETIARLVAGGVTMAFFVPTQWQALCRHPDAGRLAGRLRIAIWGASPAPRDVLELMADVLTGVEVLSTFGQTEMTANTTWLKGPDYLRKLGSVGHAAAHVDLRVVDDELHEVPRGQIGEAVYRGPTVMRGYYGNPEATAEAFAGGWFHSGDLVREDEDGYVYVVDRKKDMIISGGENIYPAEVEAVLRLHPGVADVAVVGLAHAKWVETPVAVVVARGAAPPTQDELIDHCRGLLAGYKKPTAVVFVDALPRNAGGKVLKRELRRQLST